MYTVEKLLILIFLAAEVTCTCHTVCPIKEKSIWALDGQTCHLFRNACYYRRMNCEREMRHVPDLVRSSQRECQSFCPKNCWDIFGPVCGVYRERQRTFNNLCDMTTTSCRTGKTWIFFKQGVCVKRL